MGWEELHTSVLSVERVLRKFPAMSARLRSCRRDWKVRMQAKYPFLGNLLGSTELLHATQACENTRVVGETMTREALKIKSGRKRPSFR